jgi:hypothetical protein
LGAPILYRRFSLRKAKFDKKFVTKHAKRTVSFCLKSNETCETVCFASKQNFVKQQVCFAKHKTCFISCFAKYKTKLVLLETLLGRNLSSKQHLPTYCSLELEGYMGLTDENLIAIASHYNVPCNFCTFLWCKS